MFSSKSTNSDATPAPIFSRNGERRRLTTQPECFSKTPQKKNPTHANAVTIITSHNVEVQCSSRGGAFCSVVAGPQTSGSAGRLPGDRDTQQRLCRLGGVGLVSQRRRNARMHTKRTPWLAVGTHTKSQRTHLTKPSDITQHHETCLAGRRVRPSIKLLDIGLKGRQAGMDKD